MAEKKTTITDEDERRLLLEHTESIEHILGTMDHLTETSEAYARMSEADRSQFLARIRDDVRYMVRDLQEKCARSLKQDYASVSPGDEIRMAQKYRLQGGILFIERLYKKFEMYWETIS